ncbi:sensor histidine kinase [Halpernia frigidisoli]|uniref:histidine kinase n=1 Tax=Halpernia frigidisoli TaxID=1125876 RepID=A0A1I3HYE9_9FLAO|nr:HAMP domain-containing sensor histidine kinase [Halpernia frigidisoli]SFI40734.1 Histidine kinase-, DNA gyrase B-, and HSP90-like ATPase [Halpernia frigidisoli]
MPLTKYKGYSFRNRIFWAFLTICLLSIMGTSALSYFVLKSNSIKQSRTQLQIQSEASMAYLDYAVSHQQVQTGDLKNVLENKIYEISDINKHDVILYDLQGDYLLSNKDENLILQKKLPLGILNKVLRKDKRVDIESYDEKNKSNVTSSYLVLKNNMLVPIAIVYLPFYHSDGSYFELFNKYLNFFIILNVLLISFSVWLSLVMSKQLTGTLTKFSDLITQITLFEKELKPIKYFQNDELSSLVKSYNKMILQIQNQKEHLSAIEKEDAWRSMAKQVAHEVKNPLTPMKLTIQNFERKFDCEDPDIHEKVKKMSQSMVSQIDLVASVATAFSQFAQLPDKNDEVINLNQQVKEILYIFSDENIYIHANQTNIELKIDKIYLSRIIINLVTNAVQDKVDDRKSIINVDLEQINKRINITVEDNGRGIPATMIDKIFEPNFTSKNTGMGLGLTMAKKMVLEYGGDLVVTSDEDRGSRFTVTFPVNV